MLLYMVITAKLGDNHFLTVLASVFHCIFGTISDYSNIHAIFNDILIGYDENCTQLSSVPFIVIIASNSSLLE